MELQISVNDSADDTFLVYAWWQRRHRRDRGLKNSGLEEASRIAARAFYANEAKARGGGEGARERVKSESTRLDE